MAIEGRDGQLDVSLSDLNALCQALGLHVVVSRDPRIGARREADEFVRRMSEGSLDRDELDFAMRMLRALDRSLARRGHAE